MLPFPEAAFDLWLGLGQQSRHGEVRGNLMFNAEVFARRRVERLAGKLVQVESFRGTGIICIWEYEINRWNTFIDKNETLKGDIWC
jgi:hypothetical protein